MDHAHPKRAGDTLVLVVEDEPLLLMTYEDALADAGVRWVSASSVAEALSALTIDVDVAILDIRLGDEKVFPVAYRLAEEGIPFLFCSGTGWDMPEGMFSQVRLIPKPANAGMVVDEALAIARR